VAFAAVFGSFLTDDGFRDIDVGIWTREAAPSRLDLDLASFLSQLVSLPVDVRRLNTAATSFLFHVLRGRIIAVSDQRFLAALMERVARDYHDRAPLLHRATRDAFAG
jgi:predicted nucleotidyltransferase